MSSSPRCCLIALLVLLHLVCVRAQLVNVNVDRKINVKEATEVVMTTLKMRNDGESAETSFVLPVAPALKIGDLFVAPGKPSGTVAKKLTMELEDECDADGVRLYKVQFPSPLEAGETVIVTVYMDVLSSLSPVPAEIKAMESQYMRYTGNAYFLSDYPTEEMKTVITLGSSKVTSDIVAPEPHTHQGSKITLGKYTDVARRASEPFSVRFRNDRGFLVAHSALLHYHVSHWGTVGVHEEFSLENVAAKLTGEWSRADYSANYGKTDPTSHGDVWANLPRDAENVKYKDLVGNVTSSKLRKPTARHRALQLVFRFPLLGGWKNHFWYTYDMWLDNHVRSKGDEHVITVPIVPSINYDLRCEKLEVRVSLPEGATDIELVPHRTYDFVVKQERRKSSLSFTGRPTVILQADNVRSRSKHAGKVEIKYKFASSNLFIVPIVGVSSVLAFIIGLVVFTRLDWVLVHDEAENDRKRNIKVEMKKVLQAQSSIADSYLKLQQLYNDVCRRTADDVSARRRAITETLVKNEGILEEASEKLGGLRAGTSDVMKKLLDSLKQKREYSMRFISMQTAFDSGDLQQSNYEQEMKRTVPVSKTLTKEVSNLFEEVTANY